MLPVVQALLVQVPVLAWACNPISVSFSNKIKNQAVAAQRASTAFLFANRTSWVKRLTLPKREELTFN